MGKGLLISFADDSLSESEGVEPRPRGDAVFPALSWLHDLQEQTLMDTSVQLEHRRGFALGMFEGMELLCMCPECGILTTVVSAWVWFGHYCEPLTQLVSSQQGPQYYSVDLHSELCILQLRKSQKAGVKNDKKNKLNMLHF